VRGPPRGRQHSRQQEAQRQGGSKFGVRPLYVVSDQCLPAGANLNTNKLHTKWTLSQIQKDAPSARFPHPRRSLHQPPLSSRRSSSDSDNDHRNAGRHAGRHVGRGRNRGHGRDCGEAPWSIYEAAHLLLFPLEDAASTDMPSFLVLTSSSNV
jgi:hypothetical protein